MTLTAEKLPFSGDTIQALMATVDRIGTFVHQSCQMECPDWKYGSCPSMKVCGRKAVKTCTVCEVTQCDRCDCGCER